MKRKFTLIAIAVMLVAACFVTFAACSKALDEFSVRTLKLEVEKQFNKAEGYSYTLDKVVKFTDETGKEAEEVSCSVKWTARPSEKVTITDGDGVVTVTIASDVTAYILTGTLVDNKGAAYKLDGEICAVEQAISIAPPAPETVTLTLNLNYTGSALPTTVTVNKGETYNLPTPTRQNYTFDGWFTAASDGTQYTSATPINDNTTLYAHWTLNKVSLTLDLNYTGSALPTTVSVDKGGTYDLTTPTRDGYTFDGWFTLASGGTKYTSYTPINADTTLYAHWTQNKVKLTLNPNYDGATSQVVELNVGETYTLQPLTREGYTFDGWFDMLGTKHSDEITVTENTVLVARWTAKTPVVETVTITLNLNYTGAAAPTTETVNKGTSYTLTTPTRSGYTFDGWYDQATGGTKQTSPVTVNTNTTLYAHWTENTIPSTEKVVLTIDPTTLTMIDESASTYYEKYNGAHTINGYTVTTSNVSVNAYEGSPALQFKAKEGMITVSGAFSKLVLVYESSWAYANSLFLVTKDGADIRPAAATSEQTTGRTTTNDSGTYDITAYIIEITLDASKTSTYQIGCLSDQGGVRYFASVVFYGTGSGTVTPDPTPSTHTCQDKCTTCGKCTSNCTDPVCASKCTGHTNPTPSGDKGTQSNPYTVAEALAEINKLSDGSFSTSAVYVQGIVSGTIKTGNQANTYNFDLVDVAGSTDKLIIWYALCSNGTPAVGDTAVIYGYLQKYGSGTSTKPEMNTNGGVTPTVVSLTSGSGTVTPTPTPTPGGTLAATMDVSSKSALQSVVTHNGGQNIYSSNGIELINDCTKDPLNPVHETTGEAETPWSQMRLYQGSITSVTYTSAITTIVIKIDTGYQSNKLTSGDQITGLPSGATATVANGELIISLATPATTVSFTVTVQVRATSVEVYC